METKKIETQKMYKFIHNGISFMVPEKILTEQIEICEDYFGEFRHKLLQERQAAATDVEGFVLSSLIGAEVKFSEIISEIRKQRKTLDLIAAIVVKEGKRFKESEVPAIRTLLKELPAEVTEAVLADFFIKKEVQSLILGGYFTSLMNAMIEKWVAEVKQSVPIENP